MTRAQAFAVAAVIEVLAWATHRIVGVAFATLAIIIISLITAAIHPRVRHTGIRGCGGSGEHHGLIFRWRFRKCPGCNSGRLVSWTAGHFGAGHIKGEYASSRDARAAAREGHRWR